MIAEKVDQNFGRRRAAHDIINPSRLTVAGTILGTVGYMSPEQAMGGAADHTADQFSFGAILYEMLSGRRAFARDTTVETLAAIIREHPPAIRTFTPEITETLQQIVNRCLAKDPAQRYRETRELAAQIRDVRDGMAVDIGSHRTFELNRRRAMWLAATAALGAIATLAGWKLWPHDTGIRSLAVLPFETTQDQDAEFLSVLIAESLIRQIASLRALRILPRNAGFSFKGKNVDPIVAGQLLDVDAVVSGTVARRSGRLHITAELTSVRTRAVLWGDTYDEDEAELLGLQDKIASKIVNTGIRYYCDGRSAGSTMPLSSFAKRAWPIRSVLCGAFVRRHCSLKPANSMQAPNATKKSSTTRRPMREPISDLRKQDVRRTALTTPSP
jgi:TolB-like protein